MRIPLNIERESDEVLHRHTQAYRTLLQAFGYPMRVHHLEFGAIDAVIECLLDSTTTVALSEECLALKDRILATGAAFSEAPEWFFSGTQLSGLSGVPSGTREAPEDGAMVVLAIDDISESRGTLGVRAQGAGLLKPSQLYFSGLKSGVIEDHIALNADYPCGVDLLLCTGNRVATLPRHLKLEIV